MQFGDDFIFGDVEMFCDELFGFLIVLKVLILEWEMVMLIKMQNRESIRNNCVVNVVVIV